MCAHMQQGFLKNGDWNKIVLFSQDLGMPHMRLFLHIKF